MERDVHFNRIYVVQSLPNNERQTGTELMDNIITRWVEHRFEKLKAEVVDIASKEQLEKWLNELENSFHNEQIIPYLHFEIHGSKKGLQLKNKEFVEWEELRSLFTKINCVIHNNLFISLATCYGAYIFQAIDVLDRIPFYAFVGPVFEIKQHEVEADWTAYFDTLLTTRDLSLAVEVLNQINIRVPYAFFTSEQIFDKMAEILIKPYKERRFRRERLFKLLKKAKKTPAIVEQYTNEELMTYFKKYVSNQPRLMGYWREFFLMQSDVTPIERL